MVSIDDADVVNALHRGSIDDLPTGYESDIQAAETLVGTQVAPYAAASDAAMVDQCAVYVACAFITGTENENPIQQLDRESQSIRYDTDGMSDEASDYWSRAKAFDPTGRLGQGLGGDDAMFRTY